VGISAVGNFKYSKNGYQEVKSQSFSDRRSISFRRSLSVLRRDILRSRLPLKIFSMFSSLQDSMFLTKSGGSVLTIFSRCANLASEIFSALRAFAQVIRPGPWLI